MSDEIELDLSGEDEIPSASGVYSPTAAVAAAGAGGAVRVDPSPAAYEIAREIVAALSKWRSTQATQGKDPTPEQIAAVRETLVDQRRHRMAIAGIPDIEVRDAVAALEMGLYGLEAYLDNPLVSDIMVNAVDKIFVEEAGSLVQRNSEMRNADDLIQLVRRLGDKARLGDGPTREEPVKDGRFVYDSPSGPVNVRVNMILGAFSVGDTPVVSLRKPTESGYDHLERWTEIPRGDVMAPLPADSAHFLRAAFRSRANILLVGGTGSGKTSLMRAMIECLADLGERTVVVEEANELDFRETLDNVVGLLADRKRPTLAELIEAAMRMRPDRIVVGECRRPTEVLAFLQAVNTGHAGSITTTHASDARDGLERLLTLAASAETKSSVEHLGKLISSGLDLVVYLGAQYLRAADGSRRRVRRVMEVAAVSGFRLRDGAPHFDLSHVFIRNEDDTNAETNFMHPMRGRGPSSLIHSEFGRRMRSFGLTDQDMIDMVKPRERLEPIVEELT